MTNDIIAQLEARADKEAEMIGGIDSKALSEAVIDAVRTLWADGGERTDILDGMSVIVKDDARERAVKVQLPRNNAGAGAS